MIKAFKQKYPMIDESAYVADNAVVIGDVHMDSNASIWFFSLIRGDTDTIFIGEGSNIQDHCTLHTDVNHMLRVGKRVTIGHNVTLHGAVVEDEVLIGMGAIILNGAHIGKHSIIAAGALVKENQIIPENSLAVGCPAKVIKQVTYEQIASILENAKHYELLANEYKEMGL